MNKNYRYDCESVKVCLITAMWIPKYTKQNKTSPNLL